MKQKRKIKILIFLIFSWITINAYSQSSLSIQENDAKAQEYIEQGNNAEAARLYTQSAFYYRNQGENNKAVEYYLKVLDLNKNNQVGQMLTHSNISMLYIEMEQYDKALNHLNEELKFRERNRNLVEILPVLLTISTVQIELKAFEDAERTVDRAIEISKELNELRYLKRAYGVAYDVYTEIGKQEKAQEYFDLYSTLDKKLKDDMMAKVQIDAKEQVSVANTEKAKTEVQLKETNKVLEETVVSLQESERIKREQEMELNLQQAQINEQNALLHLERVRKRFWAIGFIVALLFVFALTFLVLKIISANKKIEAQRLRLEKQNHEISSSINYAETIQKAMLPDLSEINDFGEAFIIYRPKDIVSGDFYWLAKVSDTRMYFAIVDCTGHGVPGAFMSMIGIRILSEIVREMKVESPAAILENLNDLVRESLRQDQTDNNDGMDLAIVRLDKQSNGKTLVTFSGAKRPLYIGRDSGTDLEVLKSDRKSIGGHQPTKQFVEFNDQSITLSKGDELFLFSDGIVDQNDPYRKKFGRARLESILKSCLDDDLPTQQKTIESKLDDFIQDEEQRDDITLAGFKLK